MSRYVVVDGNIGSGKTTLVRELGARGVNFVEEPVERWCAGFEHRGEDVRPPLELFYRDPKSHALAFQIHVLTTRMQQLIDRRSGGLLVLERDPFDVELFVESNFASGAFDRFEHRSYVEMAETARRLLGMQHAGSVYLRLDPETCSRRISERGREAESGVGEEHVRALHGLHEIKYASPREEPSMVVDAGMPPSAVADAVMSFLSTI